ncbi:hypothetical protein N9C16_05365 [Paracoccaceae bacterium]|nr:hypothetical protein [Paracoccaceae bacterium]
MLEKLKKMLLATKILLSFERRTGQVIIAKPPRPLSPAPAKCYNQEASIKAFADGIATGDIIHQAK